MSWSDSARRRRFGFACVAALALGACQPLHSSNGGPVTTVGSDSAAVASAPSLAAIDILPIDGRVGLKIRNDLRFALTGGGEPITPPRYRLDITVQVLQAQTAIVDPYTDRPELETAGIDAAYTLVEVGTGMPVLSGNALGRATYTRNRQRFASVRAERDAEDRAARIVVEQIRAKLLAHFSGAGT